MHVDTLTSIKAFRQVVESGSFVAAAERVDLSTAMVSKHVMHIEKRLGVRLLNRNSRTLSLTEPGRLYYERCRTILDDLEATELELGTLSTEPRGTLRITAPSWVGGSRRLAMVLAEYRRRYPQIVVDASFEDPAFKEVLVPVLSEYPLESPTLYVIYASRKYLPLKIRAFIDFLFESIPQIPMAKPSLHRVAAPGRGT